MANLYDFGSVLAKFGGDPVTASIEELERRKRKREEEEMALTGAAIPEAPTAPVVPVVGAVETPTINVREEYNKRIAQQESGNRPDIGYHMPQNAQGQRASTAWGTYGITAPAYKDIQSADPYFASKPITELTPEEQTRANTVFTNLQSKRLTQFGIEPTEQNLSAAHFLGARGLKEYLANGYIHPAAARANGGEENVRRIVDSRLQGAAAPASGAAIPQAGAGRGFVNPPLAQPVSPEEVAAQQPVPTQPPAGPGLKLAGVTEAAAPVDTTTQAISAYQKFQDDPKELLNLRNDQNMPEFIRERAGQRVFDLMNQEVKQREAKQQMADLARRMGEGDPRASRDMAKALSTGGEEGSWLKYFLFGFIDPVLQREEAVKLGFGNKDQVIQSADGTRAGIMTFNARGKPLRGTWSDGTPMSEKEVIETAAQTAGAGKVTTSGTFFQAPTGQLLRAQSDESGKTRLVDAATGARYTGDTRGLTTVSEAGAMRRMDRGLVIDLAKKHGTNVLDAEKEYVSLNGPFKTPEERQQFRDAYGFGMATPPAAAPGVAMAPAAAPGVAMAPAATPVRPGPAVTAPAPAAVTTPLATLQAGAAAAKQEAQEFVKYGAEDITPKADAGGQVSRIRKEQVKGPDGLLRNPEIAGILQGGQGSEAANIIRDLVTGNFKDQADLSARVASMNLTPRQKDLLYRQINLSAQVAPFTLKQNAGAGAVSDAEQKANRQANIDPTRQPLYSALTDLGRSQFINDIAVARADFKASRPELKTTAEFNSAWASEKRRIQDQYDRIFEERAKYIAKYNPDGRNPGAIADAFKHYPTPEWNSERKTWEFGTPYAARAARPKLSEFIR